MVILQWLLTIPHWCEVVYLQIHFEAYVTEVPRCLTNILEWELCTCFCGGVLYLQIPKTNMDAHIDDNTLTPQRSSDGLMAQKAHMGYEGLVQCFEAFVGTHDL